MCVRVRGAPAGRLRRAPRRARRLSRLSPPLCVTLRRPSLNKGAFVPSPARPRPARRLALSGLAGASSRGPPAAGRGPRVGPAERPARPSHPARPSRAGVPGPAGGAGPGGARRPRARLAGCLPTAYVWLRRFETRPGRRRADAGRRPGGATRLSSVRWRGV